MNTLDDLTLKEASEIYGGSVSAVLVADENTDTYRALVRRGVFTEVLTETGSYTEMVHRLWFHRYEDGRKITDSYNVFIPNMSKFQGKYSKRIKLLVNDISHFVQMTVLPLKEEGKYLFFLDELDSSSVNEEEDETENKVNTIQNNIIVFTMAFDLVSDTTSSVSLTEISDDPLNYQISYSQWRETISQMIPEENRDLFLERSSPEYLRAHYRPGDMESFEVQMLDLDGVYQWVKLIFSRMETTNANDYRFVYIVQNIHESKMNMQETLKEYEELASTDPLTKVFNHGRIETELRNVIDIKSSVPVGLMILDIDHFKNVNDQYGHAVGDKTLVHLAETVNRVLSDKNAAVGRWGGEEFAVVIYGENNLAETAEMLRSQIEKEPFDVVGNITCSIGITGLLEEDTPESWFERADHALYSAKSGGRNKVCSE